MFFFFLKTRFTAQNNVILHNFAPIQVRVLPSPPAVEDWRWLTDFAVGRTETAAAAAES